MHPFDDTETTTLEVIDATLAGEAVEPECADLAELTLILAGQRPIPSAAFASALDERVARRFAPAASAPARRSRRRWLFAPGAAVAVAAAVAVVIVLSAGGSQPLRMGLSATPTVASSTGAAAKALLPPATHTRAVPRNTSTHQPASGAISAGSTASGSAAASSSLAPAGPAPTTTGRQVVQSAQLALSTRPNQVDNVAQQVFNVIGAQNGVVNNSQVTATNNASGYAQFQLSVPSATLSQTMNQLSRLHGAAVVSRTDATQDITGQIGGAGIRLADARALRTALLHKLANATTTAEIDSLQIQIRDVDASISSDLATLGKLHHQVAFSNISLTINASMAPGHPVSSGGGFTLGKAAHDAGRVLVVAAGVALITLAVLVPLSMAAAVVLWIAYAIRRRRREQALDLV